MYELNHRTKFSAAHFLRNYPGICRRTHGHNWEIWITVEGEAQTIEATGRVSEIVLAPAQLRTMPNIGEVDVFRSLQLLPGISGVSDGSSGLYVQGGTPDQNLVLFDGMTVYPVDHFFGLFSAFNDDAIKDIQVYRAGFPAKYGGRLASVVEYLLEAFS